MSDFEDQMDVDTPTAALFSGHEKTKRSAANLPVEAQDSLPWVEKYRPNSLADVSGHQDILATINKFVDSNKLPHLLLYGPPGTGKTSTVLALARRIYGSDNVRQMVLELNASDDRGIDVVREQIKTFSSTRQIFASTGSGKQTKPVPSQSASADATDGRSSSLSSGTPPFKLIILDEADAMTATAQMALRRIMEKYTANTRFCIIANYTHKLSPALLSRCTRFRFSPLPEVDIRRLVDKVITSENVDIQPDATDSLVRLAKGDMRRALNVLQACHASQKPMGPDEQTNPITTEAVYACVAEPDPVQIETVLSTVLESADFSACVAAIRTIQRLHGLALADIITGIAANVHRLKVAGPAKIAWLSGLADLEHRLSGGANEMVQTGALVGVLREGVDLMDQE